MTTLTVRLPNDKHARLKTLARRRGTSVKRLIEEMATLARQGVAPLDIDMSATGAARSQL